MRVVRVVAAFVVLTSAVFCLGETGSAAPTPGPAGTSPSSTAPLTAPSGGSTSTHRAGASPVRAAVPAGAITFSEYSTGTYITNQYQSKGVIFSGDQPFITSDSSNPTSPVLAGSPQFYGQIDMAIVNPATGKPSTASGVQLDVGYIDNPGSVQIRFYGLGGSLLGAVQANGSGINTIQLPLAGISRVEVQAISDESAGFAIDNVLIGSTVPVLKPKRMVSLGDSYTSGEGLLIGRNTAYDCGTDMHAGAFITNTTIGPGTDPASWCNTVTKKPVGVGDFAHGLTYYENTCHRSGTAWANVVRNALGIAPASALFVPCSGAVTANLGYLTSGNKAQFPHSPLYVAGANTQKVDAENFRKASAQTVDFVTVGVGGNDAGFKAIIEHCINPLHSDCGLGSAYSDSILSNIESTVYERLVTTFSGIRAQFASARILAYGYPSVLDDSRGGCAGTVGLDAGTRQWFQDSVLPTLNQAVEDAAATAGVTYMSIDQVTKGHEICTGDPWINGLRTSFGGPASESFHPNQKAHAAIAQYFLAHFTDQHQGLLFANPSANPALREVHYGHSIDLGSLAVAPTAPCGSGCTQPACSPTSCSFGVAGAGYAPNSTVTITVHSNPIVLGTAKTDANGNLNASFAVPAGLPGGLHVVSLTGTGTDGLPQQGETQVVVARVQYDPPRLKTPNESFVTAAHEDFLSRPPTPTELKADAAALDAGTETHGDLPTALASSGEWTQVVVDKLYQDTLGRDGDADGLVYWSSLLQSGKESVALVAANFYASPEYFNGFGKGSTDTWLRDLYAKVLLRAPDASGLAYWTDQVDATGRVSVAYRFFQSSESAHTRVKLLFQSLLGRSPDATGWDYWAARVVTDGDLALAANLAASTEYFNRAHTRFP